MALKVTFRHGDAEPVRSVFGECRDTKVTTRMEIDGFFGKKYHVAVSRKKPFFFSSAYQGVEVYNLQTKKKEYVWIDKENLKHRFSSDSRAISEVLDVVLHDEAEKAKKLNPALTKKEEPKTIATPSLSPLDLRAGVLHATKESEKVGAKPPIIWDLGNSDSTSAEASKESVASSVSSAASLESRVSNAPATPKAFQQHALPDAVKNAFAQIPNTKGKGLTDEQRVKLHSVFKNTEQVSEPTLLDRKANSIARDVLQGPQGQGFALMDLTEAGDAQVAKGGFKRVYHAVGLHDGGDYVVAECDIAETMREHEWTKEKVRKTLLREMGFAKKVKGLSNVVEMPVVHEANGKFYFIMKRYKGSLSKLLKDLRAGRIKMSLKEKLKLGRDLIKGVAAMHEIGLIHRDIKPGNILIDENGRAVYTDWGLSTLVSDTSAEGVSRVCGTPSYYAPELTRDEPSTPAVDLWDLGIVLYNLFTGDSLPWEVDSDDSNPGEIPHQNSWRPAFSSSSGIPRALRRVITDLMRVDPKERMSAQEALVKWDSYAERLESA